MRPERHTSVPGPSAARRTAPRLLVAPLVAALALAGCGSPEPPPSQGEPTAAAGVATARPTVDPTAAADAGTFGPWRRRAIAPSAGIAEAGEAACRAQEAVGDLPLRLMDNRGEAVLTLVFAGDEAAAVCHAAVTEDGVASADARALPAVVAAPAPAEGKLGGYDLEVIETPNGARVVIVGRVSDVPEVSVSFDDGTWGRMTMDAGWYTGWWPQAALAMSVATVDRRNVVISSFPVK